MDFFFGVDNKIFFGVWRCFEFGVWSFRFDLVVLVVLGFEVWLVLLGLVCCSDNFGVSGVGIGVLCLF